MKTSILHVGESRVHEVAQSLVDKWQRGDAEFTFATSGSTGPPKLITLSREILSLSAQNTFESLQLGSVQRAILCLNPDFIGGAMMIIRALEFGWDLIQCDPSQISEVINHPPGFISLAPIQFRKLTESKGGIKYLNSSDAILLGGSRLSQRDISIVEGLSTPVFHGYGMTETASHIALRRLNGQNPEVFFQPVGDAEITLDDQNRIQINGSITGHSMLRTNDIGQIHGSGLEIKGRSDFVINSGGIKIHPEQVEFEISNMGVQLDYIVAGIPDPSLGEKCVVISDRPAPEIWEEIKKRLDLPKYHIPKDWIQIQEFPRTKTGKIDRFASIHIAQLF